MSKRAFETRHGKVWVRQQSNIIDYKVWWDVGSRVGEHLVPKLGPIARWHPRYKSWFVPGSSLDTLNDILNEL